MPKSTPSQDLGSGFQITSTAMGTTREILFWKDAHGGILRSEEREFNPRDFDQKGLRWEPAARVPEGAEFIGTYPRPVKVAKFGH